MPVVPDDLNEIFDAIDGAKEPFLTDYIPVADALPTNTANVNEFTTIPGAWVAAAANGLIFGIPIRSGQEIVNIRAIVQCGTGDVLQMKVYKVTAFGNGVTGGSTQAQVGGTQTSAHTAGVPEPLSVNALNDSAPASGGNNFWGYQVEIIATAIATAPTVFGLAVDRQAL